MNRIKWNDGAKYIGRCHVCMWCFETILRKCWCMYCWYSFITRSVLTHYYVQHDNDNGKSLFSLQTHNLRTKYWAKLSVHWQEKTFVTSIPRYTWGYRIYAVRELINTRIPIWNDNNTGLYLTIASEIIALNTEWSQNYTMKLFIFFILHNQLHRKQMEMVLSCMSLVIHTWNKSLQ